MHKRNFIDDLIQIRKSIKWKSIETWKWQFFTTDMSWSATQNCMKGSVIVASQLKQFQDGCSDNNRLKTFKAYVYI
jgi:hypothetical protein